MQITRGPRRQGNWPNAAERTDSKDPGQYIETWKQSGSPYSGFVGGYVELEGTKKRDAQRNSKLKLWLSHEDVCALFNALLERKAEDEQRLRRGMRNIDRLLSGPNGPKLLQKIREEVRSALGPEECTAKPRRKPQIRHSDDMNWNPFSENRSPAQRDGRA